METLRARHAEGGEKSPYAEPLHIVFGSASKKKKQPKKTPVAAPVCRGKIRLRFTSFTSENSNNNKNLLSAPAKVLNMDQVDKIVYNILHGFSRYQDQLWEIEVDVITNHS